MAKLDDTSDTGRSRRHQEASSQPNTTSRSTTQSEVPPRLSRSIQKAGITVRYEDWGVRSQQWAGLCSVSTSVRGVPVHYVRAEPVSAPASLAPVHLLVPPPMTGSASMWIDLVPHPRQLRLEGKVVLHGWSTGVLVAATAAGILPDQTRGVVRVAPALPWRVPHSRHSGGRPWDVSPLQPARRRHASFCDWPASAYWTPSRQRSKMPAPSQEAPPALSAETQAVSHAHRSTCGSMTSRRSAGIRNGWRARPRAFASVIKAVFITQRRTNEALDSVRAPVLVVWGRGDHLVDPRHCCSTPGGRAGSPDPSMTLVTCFPSRRLTSERRQSASGSPTSRREVQQL